MKRSALVTVLVLGSSTWMAPGEQGVAGEEQGSFRDTRDARRPTRRGVGFEFPSPAPDSATLNSSCWPLLVTLQPGTPGAASGSSQILGLGLAADPRRLRGGGIIAPLTLVPQHRAIHWRLERREGGLVDQSASAEGMCFRACSPAPGVTAEAEAKGREPVMVVWARPGWPGRSGSLSPPPASTLTGFALSPGRGGGFTRVRCVMASDRNPLLS